MYGKGTLHVRPANFVPMAIGHVSQLTSYYSTENERHLWIFYLNLNCLLLVVVHIIRIK